MSIRIIGGVHSGLPIRAPKGRKTRPTLDRVKESLFNILQYDLAGSSVLDLYAGSGALGLESISRGARLATFVDKDKQAIMVIHENIAKMGVALSCRVYQADVLTWLVQHAVEKFDLVFVDAPYAMGLSVETMALLLPMVAAEGTVVLEMGRDKTLPVPPMFVADHRFYGDTQVVILRAFSDEV